MESEIDIHSYLTDMAPLEKFYIFNPNNDEGGLIGYQDVDGAFWNLMEDNDEVVSQALRILREHGVPEFQSIDDMQAFMNG